MENIEENSPIRLEDVDSIEELPKLEIDNETEIVLTIKVSKPDKEYDVTEEVGIGRDELMKILKIIGYGEVGWEKYNIVEKIEELFK